MGSVPCKSLLNDVMTSSDVPSDDKVANDYNIVVNIIFLEVRFQKNQFCWNICRFHLLVLKVNFLALVFIGTGEFLEN